MILPTHQVRSGKTPNVEAEPRYVCEICGLDFKSKRAVSGHRIGKHVRKVGLKNSTIDVSHLSDAQKGYIAAFLDGEGGIQITKNFRKDREYKLALHPMIYFCNTNRDVIERLKSWLSTGSLALRREKEPHKDTYALNITGTRNILELLQCLRPYLIVKLRQADILIEYCQSRLKHLRANDRQFNQRELELYTALIELNKKGR